MRIGLIITIFGEFTDYVQIYLHSYKDICTKTKGERERQQRMSRAFNESPGRMKPESLVETEVGGSL